SWIQCGCWSWSSAASSHVIRRSFSGMNDDRMLSSVVLPEPVPPETRMFRRARTHERRNVMISGLEDLNRLTMSAGPHFSLANFRISLAWICTLAAVNAGDRSPPTAKREAAAGAGGAVAAGCATGVAACGL